MEPATKGHIEWRSPPNSWLLDYSYAWASLFEFAIIVFVFLAFRDGEHRARMGGYVVRHASILAFLCFAPSSAFLISYTCDPSPPDVSGVSDMFGQGAYLGWLFVGIGTLVQHEIHDGGRFFLPHYHAYSRLPASDSVASDSVGNDHVSFTRIILNRAQDFGYDSLGFLITTCIAMAYYVVQVRAGNSGPMIEAPEHVVCYGCILSALLYLGALGLPAEPTKRKQTRVIGWGCLFLAGILILCWKNSTSSWLSSLICLQVVWIGILLVLMCSNFMALSAGRRDGASSTSLICIPSDLRDQGGFLINFTGLMMVAVVDWMGVTILDYQWQQTLKVNEENLSEDVKLSCRYDYAFFPPSAHYVTDWGQALALAGAVSILGVQLMPKVEEHARPVARLLKNFMPRLVQMRRQHPSSGEQHIEMERPR